MSSGLRPRLVSALIFIPIVVVLIWLGPWTFALLLGVVAFASGAELYALLRRLGWSAPPFLPVVALALFAIAADGRLGQGLPAFVLVPWLAALAWLFRPVSLSGESTGARAWLVHLLGAAYLGLLLGLLARLDTAGAGSAGIRAAAGPFGSAGGLSGLGGAIRGGGRAVRELGGTIPDAGARKVFYALLVTWACDTGAYVVGSLWGRRKLWPEVSPGKTWEGSLGGLLAAVVAGAALAAPLAGGIDAVRGAILGLLAGVAAELGDLAESRLKRRAMVKDSGRLIPGHGGLLDRLDSLLFSVPLFYYGLNGLTR